MQRIKNPTVTRPDGKGVMIELDEVGILLSVQVQDDGFIHGVLALAGKPVMVVDFHVDGPEADWTIHHAAPLHEPVPSG